MTTLLKFLVVAASVLTWTGVGLAQSIPLDPSTFHWQMSDPLVTPQPTGGSDWHSIKDPSVVRVDGKWHLFATVRGTQRSHAIVYLSFDDWKHAESAPQTVLPIHAGYFCAPQVFWFSPHQKWYLICQAADPSWGEPPYRPAFSMTDDISDPSSWTPLKPMYDRKPNDDKSGLDFWVICHERQAFLFYTSNDGRMWRTETSLDQFPFGWQTPVVALKDRIFEASHTYRIKGHDQWLTIIEEQNGHGWRFYKAYIADRLDGDWKPLAATADQAFASLKNVQHPGHTWTESVSHAELVRSSNDEHLEIDPQNLQIVFQGVLDRDRRGRKYGEIPWKLGLLTPVSLP